MEKPTTLYQALQRDERWCGKQNSLKQLFEDKRQIEEKIRWDLRKIQGLMRAADLCLSKFSEEVTQEEDETLTRITGQCSECWECDWSQSERFIYECVAEVCESVASQNKDRRNCEQSIDRDKIALETLRQEISSKFHAEAEGE